MKTKLYTFSLSFLLLLFFTATQISAQTTLTTLPNPPYNGTNGLTGPAQVSFVLRNNNPGAVLLTGIGNWCTTAENNSVWQLYYTATALSGSSTNVTIAPWTLIATSSPTTVPATGIRALNFPGLSFSIPGGTQYRFALRNMGPGLVRYSGTGAAISPNTFSGGGVDLLLGNVQIAGLNVGYGGSGTGLTLTPRYFTGFVTFSPAAPPIQPCAQNFDGVTAPALPTGWTSTTLTDCAGSDPWATVNTGASSNPNAAFANNPNCVSDEVLDSKPFPIISTTAQLNFRTNFNLENGWDGMVLEISIGGGPFTDIITAGGSFVTGGYNAILAGGGNPLGGRNAWSGNSGGYIPVTVNLPAAANGQNVVFRWRRGTDSSVSGVGVWVDDITVTGSNCFNACVVTCPANIVVSNAPNQCGAVVNYPVIATNGECGPVTTSPASGSFFPVGTTTVTASTFSGVFCTFTVRVNDTQPPTITCPGNITTNSAPGQCGAVVTFPSNAADNCPGVTVVSSPASGSLFPVGTTTVTQTATDGAGNTATCSFTVTVVDNVPPTIICPANITVPNTTGICGAIVNFNLPAVTDNCPLPGTLTLNQTTNSTTITTGVSVACTTGPNTWWRAYDLGPLGLGGPMTITGVRFGVEQANAAQTVTVRLHTSAGAFPGGTRTQIASQTVNVTAGGGVFYNVNLATPVVVPANAIVVAEVFVPNAQLWLAANSLGQSQPVYLSAPACGATNPVTIASLGFPNDHVILGIIGTVPVVPPVVQQTAGLPSGSTFPVGTTTNTFVATDAAGNTSTCSFTVTVNDTEPPSITCPANVTRNTDPGVCYATYTPPQPTFADNCAVTRLTWAMTGATTGTSPATGINYVPSTQFGLTGTTGVGVTTITYTAADAAGNTRTCSFTVTVNDASIPVISVQPATKFVCAGSDAVFSVTASAGAGNPLTYQWQQWNGSAWVNIPGATASTLTLPAVTFAMNTNTYRVVLTGRCSVVNSGSATLYINPLPSVTLVTSIPPAIQPGQSLNIISTVNPAGGSYAWYRNGVLLISPLQQGPVLSNITVNELGTYRLVYTDLNGCVNTSADVVVSGLASDKLWVYPVPNNGNFQVRFFNQVGEQATVRVFDAKGAKVYERSVVTAAAYTQINVELGRATADGMYVVELVNAAGRRVGAKQIIVRRKP